MANRGPQSLQTSPLFRIFREFSENPQPFTRQYELDKSDVSDKRHTFDSDDPFLVSHGRAEDALQLEPQQSSQRLLLQFFQARLTEEHTLNRLHGVELYKAVKKGVCEVTVWSDLSWTSELDQESRWDRIHKSLGQQLVNLGGYLQIGYSAISAGLKEGFQNLMFVLCYVWTSKVFLLPWLIIRHIYCTLFAFLTLFTLVTVMLSIFKQSLQLALLHIPMLQYFGSSESLVSNVLSVPDPLPPLNVIQMATNETSTLPHVLEDFMQFSNISTDLLVVQKILQLTAFSLEKASVVVEASELPLQEQLGPAYSRLTNLVEILGSHIQKYRIRTLSMLDMAKTFLSIALRDLDRIILDPNLSKQPSSGFLLKNTQWSLDTVAACCAFNPYPWEVRTSAFCLTAFSARLILDREIACIESLSLPISQPEGCIFMLSQPPVDRTAVLLRREKVFDMIAANYFNFLRILEDELEFTTKYLNESQQVLKDSKDAQHKVNALARESKNMVDALHVREEMEQARREQEWTSRRWFERFWDWVLENKLERVDVFNAVRRHGQFRDLNQLDSLHDTVSNSFKSTEYLVSVTLGDLQRARRRMEITHSYATKLFCFPSSANSPQQYPENTDFGPSTNCGTNSEFLGLVSSMLVEMRQLQPFLERIEHAGVMGKGAERNVELRDQELTQRCLNEKRLLEKDFPEFIPYAVQEVLRAAKEKCLLTGWMESI